MIDPYLVSNVRPVDASTAGVRRGSFGLALSPPCVPTGLERSAFEGGSDA